MSIVNVEIDQGSADARQIVKVRDPVRWGDDAAEPGGDESAECLVLVGLEEVNQSITKVLMVVIHQYQV